jgi:hypothetical protein
MNTIKLAVALGTAAAVAVIGSPSASASPIADEPAASSSWPYAVPLEALGGSTLAQYIADHQAERASCCTW